MKPHAPPRNDLRMFWGAALPLQAADFLHKKATRSTHHVVSPGFIRPSSCLSSSTTSPSPLHLHITPSRPHTRLHTRLLHRPIFPNPRDSFDHASYLSKPSAKSSIFLPCSQSTTTRLERNSGSPRICIEISFKIFQTCLRLFSIPVTSIEACT